MNRADGDRRVGQTIKARRELATQRVGGRAWLNGRGKRRAAIFWRALVKRGVRGGLVKKRLVQRGA